MSRLPSNRLLVASLLAATTLTAGACTTSNSSGPPGGKDETGPIKIGFLIPLTGNVAEAGGWISDGIKYGVKQVNAAGGINNRQIELVTVDTAADPTQAVTGATKLITQDKVDFIIGPITSDEVTAVLPIENRYNVASIPIAGSPDLTPEKMPNGFSILLNASDQAKKMVDFAAAQGYTKVAILHDNGLQGLSADSALVDAADRSGLQVTDDQQYQVGATNVDAQALTLKNSEPDALLLFPTTGTDSGHVLASMKSVDWDPPVIGGYGAHYSADITKIAGEQAMSKLTATTYASFGVCPGESEPAATKAFIPAIEKFNPEEFDGLPLDLAAASSDAIGIAKQAIEGAGTTSGDQVSSWLESNASSISGLINPTVTAGEDSHFLFGPDAMVLIKPGSLISDGIYERADCN